jgi:acetyl-CoA carboxylase biotin carboxyl carrier protein
MSITADEISRILALLEKSSFDEIRVDEGDLHIALSRNGVALTEAAPAPSAPAAQPAAVPAAPSAAAPASSEAAPPPPASAPAGEVQTEAGLVEIKAPIVGIFYIAPEPGAEPFVTAGQTIDAEATVGIIEVMKVFNTVPAGVSGTVVQRLVENGDFVEFGQPIFLVRPDGA